MTFKTGIAITACALSAVLLTSSASFAESMSVKADLQATSEVPPTTSKGSGALTGTYDTSTKVLTWSVTYSGLTGAATAAHFHAPAAMDKNAGVEIPLKGELASPIKGNATLTDEQAKNLTEGMTYFNVHTAANKGGEIRGQLAVSK